MIVRSVLCSAGFFFSLFLFSAHVFSQNPPPDVIEFAGASEKTRPTAEGFSSIYSGTVQFSHKKHLETYGIACGGCHHNDSGEPMAELKPGMEVTQCMECHSEKGLVSGARADQMGKNELLEYKANAMHMLCVGCHERTVAEKHEFGAPMACRTCHAEKARDYVECSVNKK